MKNTLYITIGAPATGKSTWANWKKLFNPNIIIIEPDQIREEVCGNASDQSQDAKVWKIAYSRLTTALSEGYEVVFSATSRNRKSRKKLIDIARAAGDVDIIAVYFKTPFLVALWRNFTRKRSVPYKILKNMFDTMEEPCYDEGIDGIIEVK